MTRPELCLEPNQTPTRILAQKALKKAAAVIRSKSKTKRLIELCDRAAGSVRKTADWFAKCEKFFRSPLWKLVRDEAILKAQSRCECWGCTARAAEVQLLEFPAEHLEPGFDWMNRNDILMALCRHHYEIAHRAVMLKAAPLDRQDRQFESGVFGGRAGCLEVKEQESAC